MELSQETVLKRRQLEMEIALVPSEILRAKLFHTLEKFNMFLSDDLDRQNRYKIDFPAAWAGEASSRNLD